MEWRKLLFGDDDEDDEEQREMPREKGENICFGEEHKHNTSAIVLARQRVFYNVFL